ncbi:MAG: tol-pal system protein YbgF [Xanthomonadales bacterium PRO6]|nr:tol-pal system protein YbgF [Xanthomonadales bacterium PRO6]
MIDVRTLTLRSLTAALVAAVCVAGSAYAQGRLSLAERVEQLERQVQGGGDSSNLSELMLRNQELTQEVQNLRGLVEEQAFEIENLKKRQRDQYVDLDSRLQRLEGGGMTVPARPPVDAPVEAQAPQQLSAEEPVTGLPDPTTLPTRDMPPGAEAVGGVVAAPAMATSAEEKIVYEAAFEALKQGRYAESSQLFSAFLQQYPDGEFAANATYWLGESYYVTQNYEVALETFQKLLGKFPDSRKAPDGLLKVGYCQYELGDADRAAATLNDVVSRYPDTPVARLAQGRLRALRLDGR